MSTNLRLFQQVDGESIMTSNHGRRHTGYTRSRLTTNVVKSRSLLHRPPAANVGNVYFRQFLFFAENTCSTQEFSDNMNISLTSVRHYAVCTHETRCSRCCICKTDGTVHFYRAMNFSAKGGIAIACRLSVCPSVCNVAGL